MRKAATQNKLRKEREKAKKMLLLVVEWEREIYSTKAKKMVPLVLDFCCVLLVVEWEVVRESFKKKAAILLDFVQIRGAGTKFRPIFHSACLANDSDSQRVTWTTFAILVFNDHILSNYSL